MSDLRAPFPWFGGKRKVAADKLYREDSLDVAHAVREWAIINGEHPLLRIALCGYEGEHEMPDSWAVYQWSAGDGFGGQAKDRSGNGDRERIWFSPACIRSDAPLFAVMQDIPAIGHTGRTK